MSIANKLKQMGIELPAVSTPEAAYVPFVQSGNMVYLSGHIARKNGKPWTGKLGAELNTKDGQQAARSVAIDMIATLQAAAGGDLDRVQRIVKIMGLVNSTPDYTEQHLVANGCSELLGEVFGNKGLHARSTFGVAALPLDTCVEFDLIAELRN